MHIVEIDRERPDFRVFIDLLYGENRNVDTEGDSDPVYSRSWTYLYIADRESDDPSIEIFVRNGQPSSFAVESESGRLEELAALYLFLTSGKSISDVTSKSIDVSELRTKYSLELHRAANAVWHKSSSDLPYPGLA
jgi:hypothetical protein